MHEKIQKQLEILNTEIRFFGKIKTKDHINALEQIEEIGSVYNASCIYRYVFSDKTIIAQKAANIIRKLLTKKEARIAWLNLYDRFSSNYYLNNNPISKTEELKGVVVKFIPEEAAHIYGIASLNRSGYVREKALYYLQKLFTHEILPYVFLRLNDWVPEVRNKAKQVLIKILPTISIIDLIKYYNLIEWLEKTQRVSLKDIQSRIYTQIHSNVNREELLLALEKAPFKERLFCWRLLAREILNDINLIDRAIADSAPEVRQWAASHLPNDEKFKNRLDTLFSDSAIRVRYAALKSMPQEFFLEYTPLIERMIFDDSKPIRDYARFILSLHGNDNYTEKYRKKLAELQNGAGAGIIVGLAETGTKSDISLIKTFAKHKNPKVRAAALCALNRLETENVDNLYLQGLKDKNAKVRNHCISILQSGYSHLRPELENLLKNEDAKVQIPVLRILTHYGALDSLRDILFALTQSSAIRNAAWQHLVSWHLQYGVKPWFSYSENTYTQTIQLLDSLQKANTYPPYHAHIAWNDLPHVMQTIKK